jgi:hypothetical protein
VRGVKGVTFLGVVEGLPEATAWPAAAPPPSLILISLEELDLLHEKHSHCRFLTEEEEQQEEAISSLVSSQLRIFQSAY